MRPKKEYYRWLLERKKAYLGKTGWSKAENDSTQIVDGGVGLRDLKAKEVRESNS